MFESSLFESSIAKPRHGWTTGLSFGLQTLLTAVAIFASLLYTEALPPHALAFMLSAPPPPPATPSPVEQPAPRPQPPSELNGGRLMTPQSIPRAIAAIHEEVQPVSSTIGVEGAVPETRPNAGSDRLLPKILPPTVAVPRPATPKAVRVSSGVAEGLLIRQVRPQYPELARNALVQGIVVLHAVIGQDGTVRDLRLISGHPLLVAAAIDAVRQWRYRPYTLNGEPVDVDTTIQVNFTLAGN